MNKMKLSDIVTIRFGFYAQPEPSGPVTYLQVRQFDDFGRQIANTDEYINLDKKTDVHLLEEGDVLFVGKGNRLFAWCYKESGRPTVASSVFFVLRPYTGTIYPEFLTAILNAPQSKATFQQIGSGTNIFSIRKSELGAFEVPVPSMQVQKNIVALSELHQQEIDLAQELIAHKQNLYTSIISNLIK